MELGDLARPIEVVADIPVPDDLAVAGIDERDAVLAERVRGAVRAFGVALRLA
jgi:hypothetical protein